MDKLDYTLNYYYWLQKKDNVDVNSTKLQKIFFLLEKEEKNKP
ncbi:MAG: hypothetical protein ACP5IB_09620 [Thermoplasmata archaeon]|jgi:hypothetical protein